MFEKCLHCDKLCKSCARQLYEMSPDELVALCNARRKKIPSLTYDRIVEKTKLSRGTVSGFFGGDHADYRLETIRPILRVIFGEAMEGCPCDNLESSERAAYESRVQHLERDLEWHKEKMSHYVEENKRIRQEQAERTEHHKENMAYLKEQLRGQKRAIAALVGLLGVALVYIVWTLISSNL